MSMSLRKRMILLALLPVTLVASLLTAVFLWHSIDNLQQTMRTRGNAISRQMATAAEYGIFSGQRASLSALTESAILIDSDVRGAAIVDAQGAIMARSGELHTSAWPAPGRIEGHRLGRDVLLFVEPVLRSSLPVDDIYAGAEAFQAPASKVVGHVVVELSLSDVSRESERLAGIGLLVALIGSLLGGWLAQRIARGVTRPLLEASEVVERIGHGDLAARMGTTSAGALQSLAAGINAMAERVGMTHEELHARVEEATHDLLLEKEAAEHATIAKSHFLAAASHDLRQPLHALGLFVSRLAESKAAKGEPRLVAHIQLAVDSLQNLLDAILDVSRLDEGKVIPQISSFPMASLFDGLARDLSLLAEHKGLQLRVRPTRIRVHSDQRIVERILLNLVGNALRYTRTGGVLVACRRWHDVARIEIWDTGEGIPERARATIFEEYVQLGNPERDQAKGLGLGLAICRRLAALLSAPLGLRSRSGWGSVFWIELPLAEDAEPPAVQPVGFPRSQPATDQTKIFGTVLVVESDALVRTGMEQAILSWGGRVLLAANREEALRCCRESPLLPNLAICNTLLSGNVSGIELGEDLQRNFGPMGILLVSAAVDVETHAAARRAGFPLLREPVPPGRLRAALQQLLSESL
ncbi:MAG: response regulator [Rhodocyclales bacterium]|nr:response regulator [Rhodocyclales bacterium]